MNKTNYFAAKKLIIYISLISLFFFVFSGVSFAAAKKKKKDVKKQTEIKEVNPKETKAEVYVEPAPKEKEDLLRKRAMQIWAAQVEGDKSKMYDYYDPFFKVRQTREQFTANKMPAKYYDPQIESLEIRGNVALVHIKMSYEIKEYMLPTGQKFTQEKRENTTHETWVFLDGTWYRQYIDYMTDGTFAHY